MLVLTRKAGEAICIGDGIEVRIVSVHGQKVRLAIDAPQNVAVRRKEIEPVAEHIRVASGSTRAPVRRRAAS